MTTAMLERRPPEVVMRLDRLGAFHQTRLSFVRSLVRKMMAEQWQISRAAWEIDDEGYGTVVYRVQALDETYSVVFFSNYLPDELRTDRVIAEQWDVAFVLCVGEVTAAQIDELRREVPKQEVGRYLPYVLVLSRANKSTRNFTAVVEALAAGHQPDVAQLTRVGYLFRTTAVYGNGKFGVADFHRVEQTQAFAATFRAQMFAVFMMRHFALELVNDMAGRKNPAGAVPLADPIARYLGVGNATGLGMAPFLVSHPLLIHRWIGQRETAIARVLAEGRPSTQRRARLNQLIQRARQHVAEIETVHPLQRAHNDAMLHDLSALLADLDHGRLKIEAWADLVAWGAARDLETQELLYSILLELHPELVDDLGEAMSIDEAYDLRPEMPLAELLEVVRACYDWALAIDFARPENEPLFWYRSAEKEEPRLGQRFEEPGADKEQPLGIGRAVWRLARLVEEALAENQDQTTVDFLWRHPEQRGIVRRVQTLVDFPYGEIQDNLLAADCLPIHMLRCKLSFFGASKFDPRSNLWVRITLFQGAPLVKDIGRPFEDDWFWPTTP